MGGEFWVIVGSLAAVAALPIGVLQLRRTQRNGHSAAAPDPPSKTRESVRAKVGLAGSTVRPANGLQGYWPFDGSEAMDWSGNGHDLALSGGAGYVTGCLGRALQVDGADGCASAAGVVVQTDASFTVMAWVNMCSANGFHTAVSQDGDNVSSFYLQYSTDDRRWAFSMTSADSIDTKTTRVLSYAAPALNTWVHLAGVHDADTGQVQLYVNGILNDTRTFVGAWSAGKEFQVGRALWAGTPTDFFPGVIDEVRAFSRALSAAEVASSVDLVHNLVASYAMEEGWGETADDQVGGHALTLSNTRWGGGFIGSGLRFDANLATATAARFLDTSGSFSVSAWLRLGDTADWRTAVSQDGTNVSGFFLQYSFENKVWAFSMPSSDSTSATPVRALASRPPRVGCWQHLVGVHDASAGQLRLYVDGQRTGTTAFSPGWGASGAFVVGRGLFDGPADWFIGDIDQIRVWNRALSDTDVSVLA